MNAAELNLLSITGLPVYLILVNFVLTLVLVVIFVVVLIKILKVEQIGNRTRKLMGSSYEASSIIKDSISPNLDQLVSYTNFQKKFQVSQQETFEKLVMEKFDAIDDRLDDLHNEVVTQQMARYKLNDILAAKIKVDPE